MVFIGDKGQSCFDWQYVKGMANERLTPETVILPAKSNLKAKTIMRNYNLGFISDESIYNHVRETVVRYSAGLSLREFNKNIVDPIKLTFDAKIYGRTVEEVVASECIRQMDKSNNNHIGYFHQNLFRYAGNGWTVPSEGFDVVNEERHIFVEMKNKHNTMNSAASAKTYMKMQHKIVRDSHVCPRCGRE